MSLNKFTGQTNTGSKEWMEIDAKSLSVDGISVESEKIYTYNIAPGSVGLEVWKVIGDSNTGIKYARFSGSRNFEIAAGISNPTVQIATPAAFYEKYALSSAGPVGVVSATMSPFGAAECFGVSSVDHSGDNISLYFTSDVVGTPRPSIVSFDILYPIVDV